MSAANSTRSHAPHKLDSRRTSSPKLDGCGEAKVDRVNSIWTIRLPPLCVPRDETTTADDGRGQCSDCNRASELSLEIDVNLVRAPASSISIQCDHSSVASDHKSPPPWPLRGYQRASSLQATSTAPPSAATYIDRSRFESFQSVATKGAHRLKRLRSKPDNRRV